MSISTENFIKGIYQISDEPKGKASTSRLAARLNISHAAVTDMAKKLSQKGWVMYQKYREVKLTPQGEKLALKVIRKHRLWESFLHKVLKLEAHEFHHEAEMLEHNTSEFLADKIDEFLGRPDFDPHGDPIPDANGVLPASAQINLLSAQEKKKYLIKRIQHTNQEVGLFFKTNQIQLNQGITVQSIFQTNQSVAILISGRQIVLNEFMACLIYLEEKSK